MMSFRSKDAHAQTRLNWPWRSQSPLSAQLLVDIPPEIELSDYRRLPSSRSESPSGLLHDEGVKEEPIPDLDIFFERLYEYFCAKGLRCIITKWIIEILNVLFMVCCIGFFFLFVDWDTLIHLKCGVEALESGEKPCDLMKAIKHDPLVPFTLPKMITVGSMVIMTAYGLTNFLKFFVQLRSTLNVRQFYYDRLKVNDLEIQTISWPKIIEKVVLLQKSQKLCVVRDLSEHDIIMRIMRKENYLIGMVNKGILSFPIHSCVPGAGPTGSHEHGRRNYLILPKSLEWTLNWCIFQSMFDSKFCVRKEFLTSPDVLRKRLIFVGIAMLILSPCLVIFPLVYVILRHAEEIYNHPSTASSRRWSNLSRWIFREYNEVDHFFRHRMNNSAVHSLNYLKQFPTPLVSIMAKFVSFVSGGLAGALIIIGFVGESILEGHIFGRNLLWYTIVFGTIAAISRKVVADELQVFDPEGAMCLAVHQTHYMPKRWRGKENSELVRREFETLFPYTIIMLLEEMASIFITPYLLISEVPKRVDDILRFISDFTIYVDGVGDVCSLSLFNFKKHGNRNYGSPFNALKGLRSSQGKMEKSFLSFQSVYPSCEPNADGKQFLSNLQKFKERQVRQQALAQYQALEASGFVAGTRGQRDDTFQQLHSDIHGHAEATLPPVYNLSPLGLLDTDQRMHPYILDWYYTCHPPHSDRAEGPQFDQAFPETGVSTSPPARETSEIEEVGDWDNELYERVQSHLGASTSSALFWNTPGKDHGTEENTNSNWWAHAPAYPSGPQGSFIEPPDFGNRYMTNPHSSNHSGGTSEGSTSDLEQSNSRSRSSWRSPQALSKTRYMDDSDIEEGLSLHFADVHQKDEDDRHLVVRDHQDPAPSGLPVRIIPRSSDPV
ncbi:autophagy protein 9 [Zea mays]|uniref:Autophagy-related protein 9 n=1 Tax=Zea mays TaxID=4577 RepID=A0A1D6JW16_MAIZE|nr:autophagy protein 9 [Zea mays]ONL95963.1 Autophagy protein 9 [Zea mays]ONL95964.1 Autophagy protein 9 [Zea mays]|eukprot:NP_001105821.2 autophagy protein 9 [Zea mays]